jgi:predicted HicB family RNase H-like nuclease
MEESQTNFDWVEGSSAFDDPPEAEADSPDDGVTIYLRVPRALKNRLEGYARRDKMSLNAWMMRCSERCGLFGSMAEAVTEGD